jgi:predicted transcriptional regulator
MTAAERRRLEPLVIRDKLRGMTWGQIHERHGVLERTGRNWLDRYFKARGEAAKPVPERLIEEAFAGLEQDMADLAVLAVDTPHDHVRLGALKARVDARAQRLELQMRTHRLPPLSAIAAEQQLAEMIRKLARIVEKWNLPDECVHEMLSLAEQHLGG